jgi:hypothetical protein
MPDSTALIDRSIADLQQLASAFATELEIARPLPAKTALHLRQKEALLTISILLPKLAEVRGLEPQLTSGATRHPIPADD